MKLKNIRQSVKSRHFTFNALGTHTRTHALREYLKKNLFLVANLFFYKKTVLLSFYYCLILIISLITITYTILIYILFKTIYKTAKTLVRSQIILNSVIYYFISIYKKLSFVFGQSLNVFYCFTGFYKLKDYKTVKKHTYIHVREFFFNKNRRKKND